MTFSQKLTPYYGEIFLVNPKHMSFISSYIEKDSSILDVGAGTGNVALALVEAEFKQVELYASFDKTPNIGESSVRVIVTKKYI